MVQGQSGTISYKNHRLVNKPESQWVRVEDTHEPLVSVEQWETVRLLDSKGYKPKKCADGEQSMYVGLLLCADCGFTMKAHVDKRPATDGTVRRRVSFICGNYARSGKEACTIHSIQEPALTGLILGTIREHARMAVYDEQRVMARVLEEKSREGLSYLNTYRAELNAARDRLGQLDGIMQTLCEDRFHGVLTESMFQNLMPKYEQERIDKTEAVKILQDKIDHSERQWCNVDAWVQAIRGYADLEELTQEILLELVDHIEVSDAVVVDGQRECHITIVYRFVGDVGGTLAGLEDTGYDRAV